MGAHRDAAPVGRNGREASGVIRMHWKGPRELFADGGSNRTEQEGETK